MLILTCGFLYFLVHFIYEEDTSEKLNSDLRGKTIFIAKKVRWRRELEIVFRSDAIVSTTIYTSPPLPYRASFVMNILKI